MGYTTDFSGNFFEISPPLAKEHLDFLKKFCDIRHMQRKVTTPENLKKYGPEGKYYTDGKDDDRPPGGQDKDSDVVELGVLDHNGPPAGVPGLWCGWRPTNDGDLLEWDGAEKFYDYTDWLKFLMDEFLTPWGYTVNGSCEWYGEDSDDRGQIEVEDNRIKVYRGEVVYTLEEIL